MGQCCTPCARNRSVHEGTVGEAILGGGPSAHAARTHLLQVIEQAPLLHTRTVWNRQTDTDEGGGRTLLSVPVPLDGFRAVYGMSATELESAANARLPVNFWCVFRAHPHRPRTDTVVSLNFTSPPSSIQSPRHTS